MNMLSSEIMTHSEPSLPSPPPQSNLMTRDQHKYCTAIIRNLKKHRDATQFLKPVDYEKLNIPDYPRIITNPMDLLSVDRKLNNHEYATVDDFVSDVRLIFNNCFKYNGPEANISVLCQNVESAFEKGLRQMPPSAPSTPPHRSTVKKEPSPPLSQHSSPPQQQQDYFYKSISEDLGRPKREIHCPSKDYPETYTTKRKQVQDDNMKYCIASLKELKKNKHRHLAYPFLEPVDPIALHIPDYFTIVKHPMDLSTIENKLMNNEYKSPDEFEADITLMFDNCYLYNPPTLPIHGMAKQLESIFKEKWTARPKATTTTTVNKKKQVHKVDTRDNKIAELERHLATITQQIESIKGGKKKAPAAPAQRRAPPPVKRKRVQKARVASDSESEEEMFTFAQKQKLSDQINHLSGDQLNTVVAIIQSSMPDLGGNGQEEIELEIDSLDNETLRKLNEFVNPPAPAPRKKQRTASEKLRELNKTLKQFTGKGYDSSDSGSDSGSEDDDGSSSGSSSDSD